MSLLETGEIGKAQFNSTGDVYDDKPEPPRGRIKGVRQFQTAPSKAGLGGSWGERYVKVDRLYEGEEQTPLYKVRAKQKMQEKEKWLVSTGFRPSSPPKKQTGPGTFDGAFGEPQNLGPADTPAKGDIPSRPEPVLKNFITATPKRGGFGVAGTTIAKPPVYIPDPYDAPRLAQQKATLDESVRLKQFGKPFVSTCQAAGRMTLDTREHSSTGAPLVYATKEAALPRRTFRTDEMTPKERAELKEQEKGFEKAFVPSAFPKKGYNATINTFPKRTADPYDPKKVRKAMTTSRALPDKERTKRLPEALKSRRPVKPSSGSKSGVTPSIARMNISRSTLSIGRRR